MRVCGTIRFVWQRGAYVFFDASASAGAFFIAVKRGR